MTTTWPTCAKCGRTPLAHAVRGLVAYCGTEAPGPIKSSFTKRDVYDARLSAGMKVNSAMLSAVLAEEGGQR